ncbi:MAG: amidohydrolase family protein [Planctomycetes bacterium]|nr:amidohydrolase family protein [Planctomycetota bacterium]
MRRTHAVPFLFAVALGAGAAPLTAQRPSTWRCKHVLAEDGASWRSDLVVVTLLDRIVEVRAPRDGEGVDRDFGDAWLVPGLIDLHTHLLLRPYDQMPWDEQVRRESNELRTLRAATFARDTLWAGFVAVRDLGTEGADFADVALRAAMDEERVRGPQLFVATRAIVKQGCYGPDPEHPATKKGAQVVTDEASIRAAVRAQVAGGADWIKVYADYRHGKSGPVAPTFTLAELQAVVDEAGKAGKPVAAHATTDEGIRRAVEAGVRTVEHGAGASAATLAAMKAKGVVLCPCLAATEAIVRYAGHQGPVAERLNVGKVGFQRALAAGVTIACGSDAGVFTHGENVRELELMVAHGMTPAQALASATTVAAQVLGDPRFGAVRPGATGFVVLRADPLRDIAALRQIVAVVREGDERSLR